MSRIILVVAAAVALLAIASLQVSAVDVQRRNWQREQNDPPSRPSPIPSSSRNPSPPPPPPPSPSSQQQKHSGDPVVIDKKPTDGNTNKGGDGATLASDCDVNAVDTLLREQIEGNTANRFEDLNTRINRMYKQLANCFQGLVESRDPGASDVSKRGLRGIRPIWFTFAPYASRVVGKSEIALSAANSSVEVCRAPDTSSKPSTLEKIRGWATKHIPGVQTINDISCYVATLMVFRDRFWNGLEIADPGCLTASVATQIMRSLIRDPSHVSDVCCSGIKFVNTLRNVMEDGNQRIAVDVGGAGIKYLKWRKSQSGAITPEMVLEKFPAVYGSADGRLRDGLAPWPRATPSTANAKKAYDAALARLSVPAGTALPTDWIDSNGNLGAYLAGCNGKDLMVASFALMEKAATETDRAKQNRMIEWSNNFMAFREQHDAVDQAFNPGSVKPNEFNRVSVMHFMTLTVALGFRNKSHWQNCEYHRRKHSDITKHNWASFKERITPILDSFEKGYTMPQNLWPMPQDYAGTN